MKLGVDWVISRPFEVSSPQMEGLELYAFRGFHLSSINPAWAVKRTLYNLDNISDQDRKDKLTQGHKDAVTIAAKVPEKMDDDKNSGTLQYWFGDKHINDGSKGKIGGVLIKTVGDKPEGTASNINGRTTVYNDNYWLPAKGDLGGVRDGTTGFCGLKNSDGKTAAAYYKRFNGGASIQYCDKVYDRLNLDTLKADNCALLGDLVSTKKWTKNFIGANVLHETM
jgi:hypothetical protein